MGCGERMPRRSVVPAAKQNRKRNPPIFSRIILSTVLTAFQTSVSLLSLNCFWHYTSLAKQFSFLKWPIQILENFASFLFLDLPVRWDCFQSQNVTPISLRFTHRNKHNIPIGTYLQRIARVIGSIFSRKEPRFSSAAVIQFKNAAVYFGNLFLNHPSDHFHHVDPKVQHNQVSLGNGASERCWQS